MGTIIVIPPTVIMDKMFRMSQPKPTKVQAKIIGLQEKMKMVNEKKGINKKSKKIMLPWWCTYIAWMLCLMSIGLSIFLIFSYSLQFGKEKSIAWLGSIMMSITQSVIIIQPLKVRMYPFDPSSAIFRYVECKILLTISDRSENNPQNGQACYISS